MYTHTCTYIYIYKHTQVGFVVRLVYVPEKHDADVIQNPHLK